jgi:hypothetical protein
MKKHRPWFDEGCWKLFDQSKEAKLQWLQDPSQINGDNVNPAGISGKKREYLEDKTGDLATNSKNKNIRELYRGINKRGYNLVEVRSRDSVVSIATIYGLDHRGVRVPVPVGSRIFSSQRRPDRF